MHFVFSSDDAYAMPLAVAVRSLADVLPDPGTARVTVLSDRIEPRSRARVQASCPEIAIEFVDVAALLPDGLPVGQNQSRAIYARLFAPSVLDGDGLMLYLDCDLIVLEDPSQLLWVDLRSRTIGAVRDVDSPTASCPGGLKNWRDMGIDPRLPLYNSGVLLIDCMEWKRQDAAQRVIDHVRRYEAGIRFADQDGINVVLAGRIHSLPLRWNAQPPLRRAKHLGYSFFEDDEVDEAIFDPAILHFAEGAKPWHHDAPDSATSVWRDLVQRTSWVGWKPPRGPRLSQRVVKGVRRTLAGE
jgi:lipopolysaccharide biosynthesis glycosyltransferase